VVTLTKAKAQKHQKERTLGVLPQSPAKGNYPFEPDKDEVQIETLIVPKLKVFCFFFSKKKESF
jgi:hypothetical protein